MSKIPSREEALFADALARPPAERGAFLAQACEANIDLLAHLVALVAAHEGPDSLTVPSAAPRPAAAPEEKPGDWIGRYKLLQQIGEGGCGVVWMAEQEEPVRRRVALKVIKLGMDTKAVIARFEAERQALAMMDHPNIAKVLDGGATGSGRPYFVMELVRGIPITRFCDDNKLPTKARLELFIQVCHAIQHAHQKGIIHRDIKPSNILVTLHDETAVPMVIDFGIAKATQGRLTDQTLFTAFEQFIGTPVYMSPEQAEYSALDVDTRSDIYSLGVLLYELLTSRPPFDPTTLRDAGLDQIRQIIRETEPQRPSNRVCALTDAERALASRQRSIPPAQLSTLLRGDLDWIVLKALEKNRVRRYQTVNAFAVDILRSLANEMVVARPPSTAYRLQKILRRYKVMSAAATLALFAILIGTVVSVAQGLRARRELRRALTAEASALAAEAKAQTEKANALAEKTNAQAALHFIQNDVLSQASPGSEPNRELKVRTLLDRVADRIDRATGLPPLVEASIRQTIGSVYTELGDSSKAIQHYTAALRLQRQHLGESHLDTLRSHYGLTMAHWWGGETALAEPIARQGLELSRRTLGEKDPLTLQFMQARAFTLMYSGAMPWTEIESLYLRALALHREVLGPDDLETLRLIWGLSMGYLYNWQGAKAEPLLVDALASSRSTLGENDPRTLVLMASLPVVYAQLNEFEKAETLALRVLELRQSILGEEHPRTLNSILSLARIYLHQQDFEKAAPLTDRAIALNQRHPFENDVFLPYALSNLGWEYLEQGDVAKANTLCELAVQAMSRKTTANALAKPIIIAHLGAARLAKRQYDDAEPLLRESLSLSKRYWPNAAYPFWVMSLLGASLSGQKRYDEAEPLLRQSYHEIHARQANMPAYLNSTRQIMDSLDRLVVLYDAWSKPAQAAEWGKKLVEFRHSAKTNESRGSQP